MEFRLAVPADGPALAELLVQASPGRSLADETAYVAGYFDRPGTVIEVAVRDGRLLGVTAFEPGDAGAAHLRLLVVDPALWGTGLASELMARVRDAMSGFAGAYLWCAASNARALRFYEREGWRPNGRERTHEVWGPMVGYQL